MDAFFIGGIIRCFCIQRSCLYIAIPQRAGCKKWWQSACIPGLLPKQVHCSKHARVLQATSLLAVWGSSSSSVEDLLIGVKVFRLWFHNVSNVIWVQDGTKQSVLFCPIHPCLHVFPIPLGLHLAIVQLQLPAQHADLVAWLLDPTQGGHQECTAWDMTQSLSTASLSTTTTTNSLVTFLSSF